MAVGRENVELTAVLLKNGADPNLVTDVCANIIIIIILILIIIIIIIKYCCECPRYRTGLL